MPRYEHWLPAARPSPWPGAVLCLSVVAGPRSPVPAGVQQNTTLDSWHVQLCVRHGGGYAVAREASGADAESFWRTLQTASLRGRNVWVIGACFRAEAAALGLWERMESGHVRLSGTDSRRPSRTGTVRSVRQPDERGGEYPPKKVGKHPIARRLYESLAEDHGGGHNRPRQSRNPPTGICILEDPPIVLKLMIDGGGGEVTWVDAANYGIDLSGAEGPLVPPADGLAAWFCEAASALHSLGKCGWQTTAASQAMHIFRCIYHEKPILCDTHPAAMGLCRGGLYGGRCQAFRHGRIPGRCHLLDFRGFYPYIYANCPQPTRLLSVLKGGTVAEILSSDPQTRWLIAEVEIQSNGDYPVRNGVSINYPTGHITTVLCGHELERAAREGNVRAVHAMAVYQSDYALKRYAESLYRIRCEADGRANKNVARWAKRVANCLHGKFVQRDRKWIDCPGATCPWEWAEWYCADGNGGLERRRCLAGRIMREELGGYSEHTAPAIAAAVAAAGRARLGEAICTAGTGNVHYCDTDSLIVSDEGRDALDSAGLIRLGEWGYLQPQISADWCEITGPKHYRIGGRVVCAGAVRGAGSEGEGVSSVGALPTVRDALWRKERPG